MLMYGVNARVRRHAHVKDKEGGSLLMFILKS